MESFFFCSNVGVTLQKARKRVEHHLTRIGFGKSRRQVMSREATPDPSRRNSLEMEGAGREILMVVPRERKMVPATAVYDGMLRLSFLLEACQPGTVPDAHLIAAVLDLVILVKKLDVQFSIFFSFPSLLNSRKLRSLRGRLSSSSAPILCTAAIEGIGRPG